MPECPPGVHSLFDPCPGNCAEPVEEELTHPPERWPEELRRAFWSAVNAPTYEESSALTLDFARALADLQRDEAWPHERDERENDLIYKLADLIDPEVTS